MKNIHFFIILVLCSAACATTHEKGKANYGELGFSVGIRECLNVDGSDVIVYGLENGFLDVGLLITTKTSTEILKFQTNHVVYEMYKIDTKAALEAGSKFSRIDCPVRILRSDNDYLMDAESRVHINATDPN